MSNKVKEKKNPFTPLTIVLLVFLIVYCLSLFFLLIWGVCTSFKVNDQVYYHDTAAFFVDYKQYYLNLILAQLLSYVSSIKSTFFLFLKETNLSFAVFM